VAMFCEKYMPIYLLNNDEYKMKNYAKALEEVFVELDYMLLSDEGHEKMRGILLEIKQELRGAGAKLDMNEEKEIKSYAFQAGCTSCVCLMTPDTIYCSNSGDSRAVLATKQGKVIELSHDHKPDNDIELARVKAGGGFVEDGRVQGVIAVSRAIGDWEYKNPGLLAQMDRKPSLKKKTKSTTKDAAPTDNKPKGGPYRNIEESKKHQVTSFPDIKKVAIKPEHDFIIVACDGIWDCFTNEQAVKFVRQKRERGPKSGGATAKLGRSSKGLDLGKKSSTSSASSPSKLGKGKDGLSSKKIKQKGETSFIIEELMNQGIAKGDITMSDGTGTDNMTCIIIQFRDPEEVKAEKDSEAEE